jgi:hypothetical protein
MADAEPQRAMRPRYRVVGAERRPQAITVVAVEARCRRSLGKLGAQARIARAKAEPRDVARPWGAVPPFSGWGTAWSSTVPGGHESMRRRVGSGARRPPRRDRSRLDQPLRGAALRHCQTLQGAAVVGWRSGCRAGVDGRRARWALSSPGAAATEPKSVARRSPAWLAVGSGSRTVGDDLAGAEGHARDGR